MKNAATKQITLKTKKLVDIVLAIFIMMTIGSCSLNSVNSVRDRVVENPAAAVETVRVEADNTVEQVENYIENTAADAAIAAEQVEAEKQAEADIESGYYYTEWKESRCPDYFEVRGNAALVYDVPVNGGIVYGELDGMGRTTYAAGVITRDMRAKAKAAERQSFDASCDKITGWGYNRETVIPSANGGKAYNGWFYNRSHLIADSLGGAACPENLVTGTRCQNVGNRDNNGGMAWVENMVRDYLDNGGAWVYYAATPVYDGNDLVCRSVIVDVLSDDGSIDCQVETFNVAKGHEIDYATGDFR